MAVGIGTIPMSGYRLRVNTRTTTPSGCSSGTVHAEESPLCIAGQNPAGLKRPHECTPLPPSARGTSSRVNGFFRGACGLLSLGRMFIRNRKHASTQLLQIIRLNGEYSFGRERHYGNEKQIDDFLEGGFFF